MPRGIPNQRRDPNDPPMLETTAPQTHSMPEQQHIEPHIAPPPSLKVKETPPKSDLNRPLTQEEEDWYEIKRRVKRIGGMCLGLDDSEEEYARRLMAKYDTCPEEGWKKGVFVPGLDNASHDRNQKALFEKPVKMITVGPQEKAEKPAEK